MNKKQAFPTEISVANVVFPSVIQEFRSISSGRKTIAKSDGNIASHLSLTNLAYILGVKKRELEFLNV